MDGANKDSNLTVIVVSWNTRDLLSQCLTSVLSSLQEHSFQVIVVDNASKDGSVEMVNESFPDVILVKNRKNVGFARANNQAFKLAENSMYVLLLNSDTILVRETIQAMLDFIERNDRAGIVAPALRYPEGGSQLGGGFGPSLRTAFNYFSFLSVLFPHTYRGMFVNQKKLNLSGKPIKIDWVAGTCMLIKKAVINATKGFGEAYFMYAEDIEWCSRVRKHGWDIYYLPYLEIVHYHGASIKEVSDHWLKSVIAYMKVRRGIGQTVLFRLIAACGFSLRSMLYIFASIITRKKELTTKAHQMYRLSQSSLGWRKNRHE